METTTQDVWIIDDHEPDQEIMRIALKDMLDVRRIKSFYSAESALDAISSGQVVRLILLDMQMPGIGGRGFLKKIKEITALNVPVIVLTSSKTPDDIRYCYENGACAFIAKPPDFEKLMDMVNALGTFWFKHVLLPI